MADYSATGMYPSLNGIQNSLINLAQSNNAYSASQASDLRRWQEGQNKIAMDFNAAEAGKSRDWTEYMSNTAHQREVADLKAAGLNPVLSATGGNGAAVTSGATASGVTSSGAMGETDKSASANIASIIATLWQQQNALQMQKNSAELTEAENEKTRAMNYTLGLISADTSKYMSNMSYSASKYASDMSKILKTMDLEYDETHPDSFAALATALIGILSGDNNYGISSAGEVANDWLKDPIGNAGKAINSIAEYLAQYIGTGKELYDGRYRNTKDIHTSNGYSSHSGKFYRNMEDFQSGYDSSHHYGNYR